MAIPARRGIRRGGPRAKEPPHQGNGAVTLKAARAKRPVRLTPAALVHELRSCVTEADLVQVLYRGLSPLFDYDVVLMQVLEREGWYHRVAVDTGVLQDLIRRPLAESYFATLFANPKPRSTVIPFGRETWQTQNVSTGPGTGRMTRFSIWIPIEHRGTLIASVVG